MNSGKDRSWPHVFTTQGFCVPRGGGTEVWWGGRQKKFIFVLVQLLGSEDRKDVRLSPASCSVCLQGSGQVDLNVDASEKGWNKRQDK